MSPFRRRVAAALGAGALALALSTGSTGTAQAVDGPPSYVGGWLALNTSKTASGNSVQFVTVNADGTRTRGTAEAISASSGCALTTSGADLLDFLGSSSLGAGFSAGSIGVRQKKNASGTSCSAVDAVAAETLTLDLKNVGGRVASAASLDVDLKQNAQILATATLNDAPVARFQLTSGASAVPLTVPSVPDRPDLDPTVYPCNLESDSGPDSSTANNCRWDISGPSWSEGVDSINFDSLSLTALAGSFSLMGGADGKVVNADAVPSYFQDSASDDTDASIFELVDGSLSCGDTAPIRDSNSSFTRLGDYKSTTACEPFPYSTRSGVDAIGPFVQFVKPLRSSTLAQGLWTTTFTVGGEQNDPAPSISVTLDYFNTVTNSPDVKTFNPLLPCDPSWGTADSWVGPSATPIVVVGPNADANLPYACQVSAIRGKGKQKQDVTYTAYVYGDAFMRR